MSQATLHERRYVWQRPRSVPLPLRLFTGLSTLAVVAALIFSAAGARSEPSIQLAAGPGTTISILNSKEGLAILSARNMRPGDTATGSVTTTNTGDGDGVFSLSSSALNDVPGAGAGVLSGKLDLAVVDNTIPASPVVVYSGKVSSLGVISLGTYAAGEAGTYDFTVSFPNGAAGAENAYQGATLSVTLDWDAVLVGGAPAPAVASAAPPDGATIGSASSAALTTNVAVATVQSPTLDGSPVATTVSGTDVAFATVGLGSGPHTIAGVLEGLDGQTTPFRLHFTVWSGPAVDYPYVEMNSPAGEQIQLTAADGDGLVAVPANAWSGGASGDWLVFRIDPAPAPAATGGLAGMADLYEVSSHWALASGAVTSFDKALDLRLAAGSSPVIPAAYAGGTWRRLAPIPSGTTLPGGWQDGYYLSGSQVHVLTLQAGSFALLRDVQAPAKPRSFTGSRLHGKLVLRWRAASDNEGVDAYLVYASGKVVKTLPASARSYNAGRVPAKSTRSFQVAARDEAGNVGPRTGALVSVPPVANLTLKGAKSALAHRGLKTGKLSYVFSVSIANGRVVRAGKSGVVLKGTAIPLQVSKGVAPRAASGSGGSGSPGGTGGAASPVSSPTNPAYPTYPTYSSRSAAPAPVPAGPEGKSGTGAAPSRAPGHATGASPQRFAETGPSGTRRAAGLALLAGLLVGTAGMVFRARRRLAAPVQAAVNPDEPILFWDQRLARATVSALRRLAGH
jgi:spore coat-associated protein N